MILNFSGSIKQNGVYIKIINFLSQEYEKLKKYPVETKVKTVSINFSTKQDGVDIDWKKILQINKQSNKFNVTFTSNQINFSIIEDVTIQEFINIVTKSDMFIGIDPSDKNIYKVENNEPIKINMKKMNYNLYYRMEFDIE